MSHFKTSKLVRSLTLAALLATPLLGAGLAHAAGVSAQGITFTAEQAYPEGIA